MAPRLGEIQAEMAADHGDFRVPTDRRTIALILEHAREVRSEFDTLVVLGIGGSILGTRALCSAVCPPFQGCHPSSGDEGARLIFADNLDPRTLGAILDEVDLHKTAFNVVSKSGETAETMSQFLVVRERLLKVLGGVDYSRHVVITTDAETGARRQIVNDEGFRSLSIPPEARGHLAVFSTVGLFPAAVAGIDVHALVAGAHHMEEQCRTAQPSENPAMLLAATHYLAHTRKGRTTQVVMPYADSLRAVGEWYARFWAETLARTQDRDGRPIVCGQTTVPAVGATDQHSLLQLLVDGPDDKIVTFIQVDDFGPRVEVPSGYSDLEDVGYLGGHALGELLNLEQRATEVMLGRRGRPSATIRIPAVNAYTVGQLMQLLARTTLSAAALYRVEPWSHPALEESRRLAWAMAGRKGFEELRSEVEAWMQKRDPRFVI
jgi:glucose-6-phosphate isomerase